VTISLTFIRGVHFGSCLILQSVFILLILAVIPGWNESNGANALACDHFHRLLHRLVVICLLASFVSGFLWLWFAIASMSGSDLSESLQPSLFWMVLTQTQPGRVWLMRAGIALVLATALIFVFGRRRGSKASSLAIPLCALLTMALTASLAWLGHAGAGEGPNQNLHLGGDILHLISAGVWPAGLAPFAIFLGCFLKARDPSLLLAACVATRRFSALSFLAVGVLLASGVANSYFLVGTFHALVSTDYGLLLVLKIVLACVAIGFGAWNLLAFKPQLATADGSPPDEAQSAALAKVARNVWVELCLASLVLLVVGLLGITAPATHS
jgi:putative copper resistance protein D